MISMYILISFIVQNFKKSLEQTQSYEHTPLLGLKWPICPKWEFFFRKTINIISMYLLTPFIMQNLKKKS